MTSINLNRVLEEHGSCADNSRSLRGVLLDLYPDSQERKYINVIVAMMDKCGGKTPRTNMELLAISSQLENEDGYAHDLVAECSNLWKFALFGGDDSTKQDNLEHHCKTERQKKEAVQYPSIPLTQDIEWLPSNQIKIVQTKPPKKITGTRFASVLGYDKYRTPFEVWCAITHTYEEPFVENQFTQAGRVIEPKQYIAVKKFFSKRGAEVVSPQDLYGPDAKESQKYDFFAGKHRVFGGMWDYLLRKSGKIVGVFEMKSTSIKNKTEWDKQLPRSVTLQAAMYAWLLGVDDIYIVFSYIEPNEYSDPSAFVCSNSNTFVNHYRLSDLYPLFSQNYISSAQKWWDEYVEKGISPVYDDVKDQKILKNLRGMSSLTPNIVMRPMKNSDMLMGKRVCHNSFGQGKIVGFDGKERFTVEFAEAGRKVFYRSDASRLFEVECVAKKP